MTFDVELLDEGSAAVVGADSYQQEGPLTTFFTSQNGRGSLDCWSTKVASFRTDRILRITRADEGAVGQLRAV